MKNLKYIFIVVVGLMLFAFANQHEYHTSTTKVELNTGNSAMHFTTKLVTEDLVKAVGVSSDNFEAFNTATERYIRQNFVVSINGTTQNFDFGRAQISPKATRIYFEIPNVSNVSSIEIRNSILVNEFDNQQNFITFNIGGKRDSFVTTKGAVTGKINF